MAAFSLKTFRLFYNNSKLKKTYHAFQWVFTNNSQRIAQLPHFSSTMHPQTMDGLIHWPVFNTPQSKDIGIFAVLFKFSYSFSRHFSRGICHLTNDRIIGHNLIQCCQFWWSSSWKQLEDMRSQFLREKFLCRWSIIARPTWEERGKFLDIWPYQLANKWEIILRKLAIVESKLWEISMQNLFLDSILPKSITS